MTKREFERLNEEHNRKGGKGTWGDFNVHAASRGADFWKFLELTPLLALPHGSTDRRRADLGRQLKVSSSHALKAFKLSPVLIAVGLGLSALAAFGLGYLVYNNWNYEILAKATVGGVLLTTLIFVGGLIWRGIRIANPQAVMKSWIFCSVLAIGGWIIANLHLRRTRNPQPTSAFGLRPVRESKHPRRFGL